MLHRHSGSVLTAGEHYPVIYEDWNFNSGNYLFTTDSK